MSKGGRAIERCLPREPPQLRYFIPGGSFICILIPLTMHLGLYLGSASFAVSALFWPLELPEPTRRILTGKGVPGPKKYQNVIPKHILSKTPGDLNVQY